MLTLATLPSASSTLAQIGAYSSPLFDDLLPFAILAIGFFVGIFIIRFIIQAITGALHRS